VVALYIKQDIEPDLTSAETVKRIHRQRGLAIAPHPLFQRIHDSLGEEGVLSVAKSIDPEVYWDGFDIFNAGAAAVTRGFPNEKALAFYLQHQDELGAPIGSTDSHGGLIGQAVTSYVDNLPDAIKSKDTGILLLDPEEFTARLATLLETLCPKRLRPGIIARGERIQRLHRSRIKQPLGVAVVQGGRHEEADLSFLSLRELGRYNLLTEGQKTGWLASRLALKLAYGNVTGLPADLFPMISVDNKIQPGSYSGPPFISANPNLHYSLSHSETVGMGGVSSHPVGVDIEKVIARSHRLLDYIATPGEQAQEEGGLDRHQLVTRIWTLKEAIAKGTQIGISMRDLVVQLSRQRGDTYAAKVYYRGKHLSDWRAEVFHRGDYYLSIAHQLEDTPQDFAIHWQ